MQQRLGVMVGHLKHLKKIKVRQLGLIEQRQKDNPYLPDNFIESLEENYPPQLIKAYLLGQWVNLTSGQVYDRFDRNHHVINKIPFDIKMETLLIGVDFNVMNTNSVIGVRDGDKLVIIDEISKQKDTDALAQEIKRRYPSNRILVYPDASGSARSTINASKTDIAILEGYGFGSMASPRATPLSKIELQPSMRYYRTARGKTFGDSCQLHSFD